jgi:ATP-dependent RNA helicase RhlE
MLTPMPFDSLGLHPVLERAVRGLGFAEPTAIQASLVPAALAGGDLFGLAPTGTGKTLAFLLPVAHRLLSEPPPMEEGPRKRLRSGKFRRAAARVDPRQRLRAIVLCPTRELAQQVAKDARELLKGTLLKVAAVWGKSALGPQREAIADGVDLLVGTPGRVRELIELDALSLAYLRHAVVDEADRMLDLGFLPQVETLLDRMPEKRQLVLLSATCPPAVGRLVEQFLKEPTRIEAGEHGRPARHVAQTLWRITEERKTPLLLHVLSDPGRTGVIVFTRTRRRAGWVAQALRNQKIATELFHGDRSQAQREKALASFAAGEVRVLVATDVAARGLHVPATRTVVNYDLPVLPEEFVHRVGRAGHGGGFAESFSFVSDEDAVSRGRIEKLLKEPLLTQPAPDVSKFERKREPKPAAAKPSRPPRPPHMDPQQAKLDELARLDREQARRAEGERRQRGAKKSPFRQKESRKPIARGQKPGRGVRSIGPKTG